MNNKLEGILYGLAVGDALGEPNEFIPMDEREIVTAESKFHGAWTDDTSMTLCLLRSLRKKKGFDPKDQLERYGLWYRTGYMSSTGSCDDIGKTCQRAIDRYNRSGIVSSSNRDEKGNGTLMRTAAVVLYQPYFEDLHNTMELSEKCSYVTHGSIVAAHCCKFYTKLLVYALNYASKEMLLSPVIGDLCEDVQKIVNGSYKTKKISEMSGSGYVLDSLEMALKCFAETDNFEDGVLLAVNNSKDCDTVGSIYGQLAGAYYGSTGIPEQWKSKLIKKDLFL